MRAVQRKRLTDSPRVKVAAGRRQSRETAVVFAIGRDQESTVDSGSRGCRQGGSDARGERGVRQAVVDGRSVAGG